MTRTLKEARRLWELGAAVHWVMPGEKRPVESGWTSGPRKTWEELEASYVKGYNVGIRLGSASVIQSQGGSGYLMVVDVDVKDPAFRDEALQVAHDFLGPLRDQCPVVLSGRGGGSCHYYALSLEPFKTFNLASTPGYEVSLYSEGRQVVCPPSLHPSGSRYSWKNQVDDWSELPIFYVNRPEEPPSAPKKKKSAEAKPEKCAFEWKLSPVEVEWLPIPEKLCSAIVKCEGVDDASKYFFIAAHGLHQVGCSRDEILTILTEPSYALGARAYTHGRTERRSVAEWLWTYTVKKVFEQKAALIEGLKAPPIDRELNEEELETQFEELRDRPEERGYYKPGKDGGRGGPDYNALLEAFIAEHSYKMVVDMKSIYVFRDTHYEFFTPQEVRAFAESKMDPKPLEKTRSEFLSKIMANRIAKRDFFSETIEGKTNFKNGVLDLNDPTGIWELKPHSPQYGFRGVLPFDFDPKAKCPVFKEWLSGVMLGDIKLMSIIQEYMGFIIRGGEYKYHKALWLEGVGRNGKSTFIDLLKALIGPTNYSVMSIKALVNDKFSGAELDGKIANFSEETSTKELVDSGAFKNLTGDGDTSAQKKFGDPYTLRNRAKLIMTYNEVPDLQDLSPGMLSRPIIIPFRKIIKEEEQDQAIKSKLFQELPGIFNFALRGWKRLEKQKGFTQSEVSQTALKQVRKNSCPVYQWVEDRVSFNENQTAKIYKPYEIYDRYRHTTSHPYRSNHFFQRLNLHPTIKLAKKHTNRGNVYQYLVMV